MATVVNFVRSLIRRDGGGEIGRVVILGLDCAGKTTLLYKQKLGEIVTTIPTIGFNVETLNAGKCELLAWDVGGMHTLIDAMPSYIESKTMLTLHHL